MRSRRSSGSRLAPFPGAWCLALALAWWGVATNAQAASGTAIEYFNAGLGHYFLTAFPEEAASLDAGTPSGWVRTGMSFPVDTDASGGGLPVCRFFTVAFAPKSSHFYTPYAAECAKVKGDPVWTYEAVAFYLALPDAAGNCGTGTTPVYRFYNNGVTGAPNHRYTADAGIVRLMKAQGWTQEGDAITGVFACGPVEGSSTAPDGKWTFTTTSCAGDPDNPPDCDVVCNGKVNFTLISNPDKSEIDVLSPVGSGVYVALTPNTAPGQPQRSYSGCALGGGSCLAQTLAVEFAPGYRSMPHWTFAGTYDGCTFTQSGTAALQ